MSWGAMVAAETDTLRTDHGLAQAQAETLAYDRNRHAESFKQGHRAGWWAAVTYILARQAEWDELTEGEAIRELRKGHGSIYFPLFKDDPRIICDCPNHGRIAVGPEGTCDGCLFDFAETN